MSENEFTEEGEALAGIIRDMLLMNRACRLVVESRCEAILDYLASPRGEHPPTPEVLRDSLVKMAETYLERGLAEFADQDMALASAARRMLAGSSLLHD